MRCRIICRLSRLIGGETGSGDSPWTVSSRGGFLFSAKEEKFFMKGAHPNIRDLNKKLF